MPKANLWTINYCILEIKADNESAISLAVYVTLSKNENTFYEKRKRKRKQNKSKQKDQKQKKIKFPTARVETGTIDV